MKKIKDITIWVLFQLIAITLLYLARVKDVKGAENVLRFIIITNCIFSVLIIILVTENDERVISTVANKYRIPYTIDMIYSLLFACALAWFGYTFLAIVDFIASLAQIGASQEVEKLKKEKKYE